MSQPTISFEYFNGTCWIPALDYEGNNAVFSFELIKALNNPHIAEVILANPSKDYNSTTALLYINTNNSEEETFNEILNVCG